MKYQDANQRNDTKNNQIELTNKKNIDDIEDLLDKGRISYDKAFYLAKISLELEKYEDSIRYVEEMVKLNETEFSDEERDVFITAFRFLISEKRRAWRISNKYITFKLIYIEKKRKQKTHQIKFSFLL